MLNIEDRLNFETIAKVRNLDLLFALPLTTFRQIFKTGYSRIPVYEVSKVRCLCR